MINIRLIILSRRIVKEGDRNITSFIITECGDSLGQVLDWFEWDDGEFIIPTTIVFSLYSEFYNICHFFSVVVYNESISITVLFFVKKR
jgi:hypothetical protein